jgi:hypothetical protein
MATNTTKLGLIKPDFVDVVDITDLNSNADDIDAAVGFTICTNATRPGSPWTGQSIFETDTGDSFIWDGSAWQPGGGGGSIEISATAPSSPAAGDLWWDSDNGNLYIYYDDGTSQQWVAANGPQVFVGAAAPAGYQGQLWFDSTTGKVYIYYDDGTSAQWVSAIGGLNIQSSDLPSGTVLQVVSTTKTDHFSSSSGSFVDVTGLQATITPTSTSSKILVMSHIGLGPGSSDSYPGMKLVRDGTDIDVGDVLSSNTRISATFHTGTTSSLRIASIAHNYLDSPASVSALTYGWQLISFFGRTTYINRSDYTAGADGKSMTSSITLIEVAG